MTIKEYKILEKELRDALRKYYASECYDSHECDMAGFYCIERIDKILGDLSGMYESPGRNLNSQRKE